MWSSMGLISTGQKPYPASSGCASLPPQRPSFTRPTSSCTSISSLPRWVNSNPKSLHLKNPVLNCCVRMPSVWRGQLSCHISYEKSLNTQNRFIENKATVSETSWFKSWSLALKMKSRRVMKLLFDLSINLFCLQWVFFLPLYQRGRVRCLSSSYLCIALRRCVREKE